MEIRALEPEDLGSKFGSAIYCFVTLGELLGLSVLRSLYLYN